MIAKFHIDLCMHLCINYKFIREQRKWRDQCISQETFWRDLLERKGYEHESNNFNHLIVGTKVNDAGFEV